MIQVKIEGHFIQFVGIFFDILGLAGGKRRS